MSLWPIELHARLQAEARLRAKSWRVVRYSVHLERKAWGVVADPGLLVARRPAEAGMFRGPLHRRSAAFLGSLRAAAALPALSADRDSVARLRALDVEPLRERVVDAWGVLVDAARLSLAYRALGAPAVLRVDPQVARGDVKLLVLHRGDGTGVAVVAEYDGRATEAPIGASAQVTA